MMNKSINKF